MGTLEKGLGKWAGDALSRINDISRRRNNNRRTKATDVSTGDGQHEEELETLRRQTPASLGNQQQQNAIRTIGFTLDTEPQQAKSPFAGGIPFGGDPYTFGTATPVIGFRTDLLDVEQKTALASGATTTIFDSSKKTDPSAQQQVVSQASSSESLYAGDFQSRSTFLRVFFLCLIRLSLFISKVYQDFQATKYYNLIGLTGHFIASAAILFLPTVVFTIYRVSRYLQMRLPQLRAETRQAIDSGPQSRGLPGQKSTGEAQASVREQRSVQQASSSAPSPSQAEDEGLVTARQTPTIEEYRDSASNVQQPESSVQQDPHEINVTTIHAKSHSDALPSERPQRPLRKQVSAPIEETTQAGGQKLELVNIDKFGHLPDKQMTSIVIGASEQLLHGVLFIFWQLKRQVDVLSYLIERACLWRAPARHELEQLDRLRTGSDGLEWFQDFYAAFLAILTQVYTLGLYGASADTLKSELVNSATSGLQSSLSTSSSSGLVDRVNQIAVNRLGQSLEFKDLIVVSELFVSSLVVVSLLIAVCRRDDGWLTLTLSSLGWGSLFSARIITLALAFVHLGWPIMSSLVLIHVLAIALWIYKIALDSHNNKACERQHEAIWDDDVEAEIKNDEERDKVAPVASTQEDTTNEQQSPGEQVDHNSSISQSETSRWSVAEHLVLFMQIFTLFALPSLFYWPIMFNLKLHLRPFKYLLLILTQNFLLIPAIWYKLTAPTSGQLYLLGAMGALSILGFIFIALYVACKPDLTEYFASADMQFNQAEQAGVYYEFCSRVFKMPDLSKHSFKRLLNQEEKIIKELVIAESPNRDVLSELEGED